MRALGPHAAGEGWNRDEDGPEDAIEYTDERTGEHLDRVLVEEVCWPEISYTRCIGLDEFCTIEECLRMTAKPPVSTKWVDINKETAESPEIRCRLVARYFKINGEGPRTRQRGFSSKWPHLLGKR